MCRDVGMAMFKLKSSGTDSERPAKKLFIWEKNKGISFMMQSTNSATDGEMTEVGHL